MHIVRMDSKFANSPSFPPDWIYVDLVRGALWTCKLRIAAIDDTRSSHGTPAISERLRVFHQLLAALFMLVRDAAGYTFPGIAVGEGGPVCPDYYQLHSGVYTGRVLAGSGACVIDCCQDMVPVWQKASTLEVRIDGNAPCSMGVELGRARPWLTGRNGWQGELNDVYRFGVWWWRRCSSACYAIAESNGRKHSSSTNDHNSRGGSALG